MKELEKREQLSTLKAQFVARGMTEEDAATAAEAQYGGDTSKVFELWGALITKTKEQAASDKLHDMTTPPGGGSSGDVADFAKEKDAALKAGNIPLYTSLVRREAEAKASKH